MKGNARRWWTTAVARVAGGRPPAPASAPDATPSTPPAPQVLAQFAHASEGALTSVRDEVAQLQALVRDAVRGLGQSFEALKLDVRSQGEVLSSTLTTQAAGAAKAGPEAELPRFVSETRRVLERLVAQVSDLSDSGRNVAARMTELAERLGRVEEVSRSANRLADRTTLLALNAKIEAAHAGVHGEGFGVVANEVRELAGEARGFNAEVSRLIEGAIDEVRSTAASIRENVERDAAAVHATRAQVDALLERVSHLDASLAQSVNEYADRISDDVGTAVRCLQFEDIATQVAGHSLRTLEALIAATAELSGEKLSARATDALARVEALAAQLASDARKAVTQDSMSEGEVELF